MAIQGLFAIFVLLSRPDLDPRPDFSTWATLSACPAVSQDCQRLIGLGHEIAACPPRFAHFRGRENGLVGVGCCNTPNLVWNPILLLGQLLLLKHHQQPFNCPLYLRLMLIIKLCYRPE